MQAITELALEVVSLVSLGLISWPGLRVSYDLAFVEKTTAPRPGDSEDMLELRHGANVSWQRLATKWRRFDHRCLLVGVMLQVVVSIIRIIGCGLNLG